MTAKPMMQCGHAANSVRGDGIPSCAICGGLTPDADIIAITPDLTGRQARCSCLKLRPSSTSLPFFEYRGPGSREATSCRNCGYAEVAHSYGGNYASGDKKNPNLCMNQGKQYEPKTEGHEYDSYYCGHGGWD